MVWVLVEEGSGEACGLLAEDEMVAFLWGDVVDGAGGSGGEVPGVGGG